MSLIGERIKFKKDNTTYEGEVIDKYRSDNAVNYPSHDKYIVVLDNDAVKIVLPREITEVVDFNADKKIPSIKTKIPSPSSR